MRTRVLVAATTGALALTALAVPAAQADGGSGDIRITKVVVDGDNKVTIGTGSAKTLSVSVTATDGSGILGAESFDLKGPGYGYESTGKPSCKKVSATTSTCTASVKIDPRTDYLGNAMAGTWYVGVWIDAKDGDYIWKDKAGSFKFQRGTAVTTNASPEPVKKGKTITVTGKLSRANWETLKYGAYSGQPVQLQYLKKGAKAYTVLKTVKSNSAGKLSTTVKAGADGYYRYVFAGNSASGSVTSVSDFVDVK
ncbi:calcium-binding protein [Streptomyces sp. NPDC003781]|uniref:calcium-binding protein n=1 Tax=Streptomyces sp. NPDC003781 TaxID=3364686 RepID=UPI0036AE0DAB